MPGLLVSVRSVEEAEAALAGGASVIDVKEPGRGPLGRADRDVWEAVSAIVPLSTPVSLALGELSDWDHWRKPADDSVWEEIAYLKLGLSGVGPSWERDWLDARRQFPRGPRWIAVAYADWERARSPSPALVLAAALRADDCAGILVDTWDKSQPSPLENSSDWRQWVHQARQSGRIVALAGRLDLASIDRLGPLQPDLFAVRGAACLASDRLSKVDSRRVAQLVQAANSSMV